MKYAPILLLLLLTGCAGDHAARQINTVDDARPVDLQPIQKEVATLRGDLDASRRNTQQNFTGMGAQIDHLFRDLKGMEVTAENKLDVSAFDAWKNNFNVDVQSRIDLAVRQKVEAELALRAQAQAAAQVGNNQRSENTNTEQTAGRDLSVQFNKDMANVFTTMFNTVVEAVGTAFWANVAIVSVMANVMAGMLLGAVLYMSNAHVKALQGAFQTMIEVDTDPSRGTTRRVSPVRVGDDLLNRR